MVEAIASVLAIAILGSLTIPIIMLTLARFGYFEPIEFEIFGRLFSFTPKRAAIQTYALASASYVGYGSATVSAMPMVLSVVIPLHFGEAAPRTRNICPNESTTTITISNAMSRLAELESL